MVKLFVSGFPLDVEEIELVKLFALHGDVVTIKLVRNKQTKVCKGYGFIEMAERSGAEAAVIAIDGEMMGKRQLTVSIREEEPVKQVSAYRKVERSVGDFKKKRPRRIN